MQVRKMEKILLSFLESDLLDLLNGEDRIQKNFFKLVLLYLLENKKFDLVEIDEISGDLKDKYNNFLEELDKKLGNGLKDLIELLRETKKEFKELMKPFINKLEGIRNGNSKHDS